MFNKISEFFKKKPAAEQTYLAQHQLSHDPELGYIIGGVVLNTLSERLQYVSNRKCKNFDDLDTLFLRGMLIKEKIDLEIQSKNYNERLNNTQENLNQLREYVVILNDYYHQFVRDQ